MEENLIKRGGSLQYCGYFRSGQLRIRLIMIATPPKIFWVHKILSLSLCDGECPPSRLPWKFLLFSK